MAAIPLSATVAVTSKTLDLQHAGLDIISLGAGEPDFPTPPHIAAAGKRAIDAGQTKYVGVAGLPELREAIVGKLARENALSYTLDQISVGCGAKQCLYNAMLAILDPGDEVIIPAPYWVSQVGITLVAGGKPIIVRCPQEQGYKLRPAELEAAITPRTRAVMLCSPSNPSGAVYSDDELQAIGEALERHPHVCVIVDHIYEHLVYDGVVSRPLNAVVPALHDRTLIVNGLSKAYCMTGWRVGYVAGPTHVISAVNKMQSQSTTSTATISQWAAVEALNGDVAFIAANNTIFRERRELVVDALNSIPGLSCDRPAGAFYAYPSCAGVIGAKTPNGNVITSDEDFALYLLDSGVAVVHGAAFGLSPHFRISYATGTETLREAMRRIRVACGALSMEADRSPAKISAT